MLLNKQSTQIFRQLLYLFNHNLMELRQAQQAIQRVLRDNLFARQVLATSGSLEFNRLAKYRTSKRLFARKQTESGKLYNFIILIDCSGSMGGTRFH